MSVKSALSNALAKIGRTGATSIGDNSSDLDGWLHLLMVDHTSKAYFDKMVKEDMKRIDAIIEANPEARQARAQRFKETVKTKLGGSVLLLQSEQYSLMYQTRAPSKTLDKEVLRDKLVTEFNLSHDQVTLLLEASTTENNPAQIYTVMETGDLFPVLEE